MVVADVPKTLTDKAHTNDQMAGKFYLNVQQQLTDFKAIRSTFELTGLGVPARERPSKQI